MNPPAYHRPTVFAAACAGILLFGISFIVLGALMSEITTQYQITQVQAGSLAVVLALGVLAGSIVFGPVVDRYGYKVLLIVCAFLTMIGMLSLGQADNLFGLQLGIFLIGAGGGALNGGTSALVIDISEAGKGGANLNILGIFWGIGALGMPLILGALSTSYPYKSVLTGTGLLMAFPILFFILTRFPQPKQPQGFPLAQGLQLLREPLILMIGMVLFFQSGIESLINNWSTNFFENFRNIDATSAKYALSGSILALTLGRLIAGSMLRNIRPHLILLGGMALSGLGIAILSLGESYLWNAAGLFLMGLGVSTGFPLVMGYVGDFYAHFSGTAFSIILVISLFGNMATNYLMGWVSEKFGIQQLPAMMTATLLLLVLFFLLTLRQMRLKRED